MRQLLALTGSELLERIDSGQIDPHELAAEQLKFARELDPQLGSFLAWNALSLTAAPLVAPLPRDAGDGVSRGQSYRQLPYAVKDIFCTAGLPTTAGSRILEGYVPPYSATCVDDLARQGCTLVGKTALDEFAMGSSGETCAYGVTRNPWHLDYVPGGSSSGSAAAVAALQAPMALGTDTGGSVRQPASFCGIVGFRPSYGLISRSGLIAYSSSADQCAIFTRSTLDAAMAMNAISRPDPLDSTCVAPADVDYAAEAQREVRWEGLRVGVLKPFMDPAVIDAQVLARYNEAIELMASSGARIVELDCAQLPLSLPAYYVITAAECSSNLARFDGIRYGLEPQGETLRERYFDVRSRGFGSEVKRRILLGTYVLSAGYAEKYYDNARAVRRDLRDAVLAMFEQVDVLATPTTPDLPFQLGARTNDPVKMYLADMCTVFVNLMGGAGITVPCGFGVDEDGVSLPVGLQFVGAPFRDSQLLRIAHQYEQLAGWRYQPPEWVSERLKAQG